MKILINQIIALFLVMFTLQLTGCKKEPLLNCKNVDTHSPADPNYIDYKKLRCANNTLPNFFPKEKVYQPKSKNPWLDKLCPESLDNLSDAEVFECANAELWNGLGDGSLAKRKRALEELTKAINRTKSTSDTESLGKLYFHRALLKTAMGIENGQSAFLVANKIFILTDLEKAKKLTPTYIPITYFNNDQLLTNLSIKNQWQEVVKSGYSYIEDMQKIRDTFGEDEYMKSIIGQIAIMTALPLDTGIPQKLIEFYENGYCSDSVPACGYSPIDAPFAVAGFKYNLAEAYARIGNKDKTIEYLNKSKDTPNFEQWPYKNIVLKALNNPESFLSKFVKAGPYKQVSDEMFINQNRSCLMCHGRA